MHHYSIDNRLRSSSSQCCCCGNCKTTSGQQPSRKRARPTRLLVTAALALFGVSTSAFQPSFVPPVRAGNAATILKASTVAPPVPRESSRGGLWGGDRESHHHRRKRQPSSLHHDHPQHGGFHWPWEQQQQPQHHNNDHDHKQNKRKQQQQQQLTPKDVWVQKYCTVEGLREAFGRNRNVLWGDLDATNTRRLYKTLMPVALMELYNKAGGGAGDSSSEESSVGAIQPQDLAVLAYKARVAAKLYARERCRVPARVAANLFDGYRQWRKYGSFDCTGMSYQQVWEKYAALIQQETASEDDSADDASSSASDDVTEQICLKILERSCQSNAMIDEMVLNKNSKTKKKSHKQGRAELQHLQKVQEQLEQDVRLLLLPSDSVATDAAAQQEQQDLLHRHNIRRWSAREAQKFRALRAFAKFKRRLSWLQKQNHHSHPNEAKNHRHKNDQQHQPQL